MVKSHEASYRLKPLLQVTLVRVLPRVITEVQCALSCPRSWFAPLQMFACHLTMFQNFVHHDMMHRRDAWIFFTMLSALQRLHLSPAGARNDT